MARSTTIWVVRSTNAAGAYRNPVACFTVKHECATWLERQTNSNIDRLVVQRFEDNPRAMLHAVDKPRVEVVTAWDFLEQMGR